MLLNLAAAESQLPGMLLLLNNFKVSLNPVLNLSVLSNKCAKAVCSFQAIEPRMMSPNTA